ncbi:DUF2059 domain-containing protein [Oleiagrimonas soli]|uniref:DUF2059 domain-containing protein n=1 Tax=Oleiagrimonas soli TaxID=1543381 RepID=A0A099CVE7_9GAMM|nr:DUF2059 domain-containing protein [Oleiagrimonas soli]KGI77923.1 hypothetical protein LF63_0105875 [Oleiagrimonas soli]MBB6183708.1 hypothetical protein [Oleiagrimonas soli]
MKAFTASGMAAALIFSLATAGVAQAQPKQATPAQVRQLLEVTGSGKMMHGMMEQMNSRMSGFMQQALPCVPASYWNDFAGQKAEQDLIDKLVPIYQKHFTESDMAGLLKFYRTPLGQKVIHEMPETMRESMQIGQSWGKTRMQEMVAKLKKDGTITADGKCPATKSDAQSGGK